MPKMTTERGVELEYEYVAVQGSANPITGQLYRTNVWLLQGNSRYDMGYWDEKLDEASIEARFGEIIRVNQERQYGTQGTVLRRELTPRRATQSERLQAASLRTRYKSSLK